MRRKILRKDDRYGAVTAHGLATAERSKINGCRRASNTSPLVGGFTLLSSSIASLAMMGSTTLEMTDFCSLHSDWLSWTRVFDASQPTGAFSQLELYPR